LKSYRHEITRLTETKWVHGTLARDATLQAFFQSSSSCVGKAGKQMCLVKFEDGTVMQVWESSRNYPGLLVYAIHQAGSGLKIVLKGEGVIEDTIGQAATLARAELGEAWPIPKRQAGPAWTHMFL
jgi:hypothetical protein